MINFMERTRPNEDDWPKEPLCGWAPGNYYCRCKKCNIMYCGDKRSWHCYPCALEKSLEVIENNKGSGI